MKKILTRLQRRHVLPLGCLLAADGLVFGSTNPRTVPSVLLMIAFLLVTLTSYYVFKGLLAVPAVYGIPVPNKKRLLRTLTALTGALAALQSIGQLSSRDVLVLLLLTIVLYLYISYAKSMKQNLQAKWP